MQGEAELFSGERKKELEEQLVDVLSEGKQEGAKEKEIKPPIEHGEVFDSEVELKKILKAPSSERREIFEIYKEKFRYQKEGLARMQDEFREKIEANPDLSLEELSVVLASFADRYGFTLDQSLLSLSVIRGYTRKHAEVHELLQYYMEDDGRGPALDAGRIFRVAFMEKPKGKIEVVAGPIGVHLRCYDEKDYEAAVRASTSIERISAGKDVGDLKIESGATRIKKSYMMGLDGAISLENFEATQREVDQERGLPAGRVIEDSMRISKRKFVHEQEHMIQDIFGELAKNSANFWELEDVVEAESHEEKSVALSIAAKRARLCFLAQAKNEIFAYMSAGDEGEQMEGKINALRVRLAPGGHYDFPARKIGKYKSRVIELLGGNYAPMVHEVVERVFVDEYGEIIEKSIDALKDLLGGDYSVASIKRARAMLMTVPFQKWPKEVSRLRVPSA